MKLETTLTVIINMALVDDQLMFIRRTYIGGRIEFVDFWSRLFLNDLLMGGFWQARPDLLDNERRTK